MTPAEAVELLLEWRLVFIEEDRPCAGQNMVEIARSILDLMEHAEASYRPGEAECIAWVKAASAVRALEDS